MKYSDIKLIVVDVDGTLTNGIYMVSSDGVISKSFFTRDFYALEKLIEQGINILILTGSGDGCIRERLNEIALSCSKWEQFLKSGKLTLQENCHNKKEFLIDFIKDKFITLEENVACIGDSENDIEIMKECIYPGCPADAIEEVKAESVHISIFRGGYGAVYDFGMYILNKIKKEIQDESIRT